MRPWVVIAAVVFAAASLGAASTALSFRSTLDGALDEALSRLPPPETDGLTHRVPIENAGPALAPLRARLARVVRGGRGAPRQARIVVVGSSHVGSDLVTSIVRRHLQRAFGDAGHGFVVAVPPWADYWQAGVSVAEGEGWEVVEPHVKRPIAGAFGPIGMAFDAIEPAWAELGARRASHVELWFLRQPSGGVLEAEVDGARSRIDTAHEALAPGIEVFGVPDGAHHVRLVADGARPVRLFGAVFERDAEGVVVDALGRDAATAEQLLASDAAIQTAMLATRRADLFVVWLGANEASEDRPIELQRDQFEQLIARLAAAWPQAGCLVLGPLDRRQHDPGGHPFVPPALARIAAMHREVASSRGCAFYDSMAWQGGAGAVERFRSAGLMRDDLLHLGEPGYRRYGQDLLRALVSELR